MIIIKYMTDFWKKKKFLSKIFDYKKQFHPHSTLIVELPDFVWNFKIF